MNEEIQNKLVELPSIDLIEYVMDEWEKRCMRTHEENEGVPGPDDDFTMANLFEIKECLELIDREIEKNGGDSVVCKSLILDIEKRMNNALVSEVLFDYDWKSFR